MRRPALVSVALAAVLVALAAPPASADHTNPTTELSRVVSQGASGASTGGEGTWRHLANVGPMQGTDLEPFERGGVTYVSGGTLGQAPDGTPGFVGQRIVALTDTQGKALAVPKVVADHGSSRCAANSSATALQHDVQAVPAQDTQLLIDTTDAVGRCHDTASGGLEILDVSGLGEPGFEVREIGLVRLNGLSHTVTADPARPGILYNNGADFGSGSGSAGTAVAMNWTDVVDVRSCMGLQGLDLDKKRKRCQPTVTRFPYEPDWTSKKNPDGTLTEPASCHDITATKDRLYCAGLNGTVIFDSSGVLAGDGKVAGTPLPCVLVPGTATGAQVTDCAVRPAGAPADPTPAQSVQAYKDLGRPAATGIRFLGTVNHPGRSCGSPTVTRCNTNLEVRSDEGVAISHEADPTPDGKFMFVTDERGGGVVPPGATCAPGLDNPVGNGGMHVFDISDPANITYAKGVGGKKAVYIGTSPTPSPSFCTIHVIEQVEGEARIIAAYYDGGTKIVDYKINEKGEWTFTEKASFRLPGANTWASEVVKKTENPDGTVTYLFASNSFALGEGTARGLDFFTWTGPANPLPSAGAAQAAPATKAAKAPKKSAALGDLGAGAAGTGGGGDGGAGPLPEAAADRALALLVLLVLPLAALVRLARRRVGLGGPLPA